MNKDKIAVGLITANPRTPCFYRKPKIHREGIPGRSAISSVNCRTSKVSEYGDYHLQPIVTEITTYIKDINK